MAIWDNPVSSTGDSGSAGVKTYSANAYKCPNCASNLVYESVHGAMICRNCGGLFDPETLDKVGSFGILNPEKNYDGTIEVSKEDESRVEIVCNSCGAEIVTDKNTASTFCAFCGSPALVGKRLTEEFKPQYMIPFKYSRQSAEEAFIKWAGKGKWTPFGFVSKKNVAKMTGLYVPFWLFNINATIDAKGTGDKVSYVGDNQITETFEFQRNSKLSWTHVPLDGETRIDDMLMEAIEPFEFDELIPYDYRYLPGFYADRYDQTPQDLSKRATKRALDGIDKALKGSLKSNYTRYKIQENNSRIDSMEANYALLPVWFLSYKYRNKFYYFTMNGQTGEVAGTIPVSPVKKMMFFFIVLGILAVITRFLLGIVMRGFWG